MHPDPAPDGNDNEVYVGPTSGVAIFLRRREARDQRLSPGLTVEFRDASRIEQTRPRDGGMEATPRTEMNG
jgi:hypothetical protein